MRSIRPVSARKELVNRRKRGVRARLISATAIAAAGVVIGTGFFIQSTSASNEAIAATQQLSQNGSLQHDQLGVYDDIAKVRAAKLAQSTIDQANQVLASVQGKVDATPLTTSVASLSNYEKLDADTVITLANETDAASQTVQAAATAADAQAEADAEAAQAASEAAAEAAAEAQAEANTPDGARATAQQLALSQYGWDDSQFSCLNSLWNKESGWSYTAYNPGGGATGIPQALPGDKMASFGDDWQTNATTQIKWGLDYISRGYGTPCSAWSHSEAVNWY